MKVRAGGRCLEVVAENAPTQLVGTIGVRVRDNQGDTIAGTTAGISEDIASRRSTAPT